MRTYTAKPQDIDRKWYVVDAADVPLGRLSVTVANLLRGKLKPLYSPNLDCGDYVIVVNCEKVSVSGNKEQSKMYYHHSGFPGGLSKATYAEVMEKNPIRIVEHAVKGMLPSNKLASAQIKKLKVCVGENHGFESEQPIKYNIEQISQVK
ncbi:MAG: 50S ribosomal protein L13 [Bifidobacteriaceae bacterium]|jgi:large subunit ribosomal protein L13|nr:50S ribosomal protein L13 [Bifidobacteriaceae bacterium]